jgi:hypothetical protein
VGAQRYEVEIVPQRRRWPALLVGAAVALVILCFGVIAAVRDAAEPSRRHGSTPLRDISSAEREFK